ALVGDGWFDTGDLGFIRKRQLVITGRQKEMIIVRGAHFYCHEIEDLINEVPGVESTFVSACCITQAETGSEGLALFFVPGSSPHRGIADLVHAIRRKLANGLGISPTYVVPLAKKDFPKTTSGKIQRDALKKSLEVGHFDAIVKQTDIQLGTENT